MEAQYSVIVTLQHASSQYKSTLTMQHDPAQPSATSTYGTAQHSAAAEALQDYSLVRQQGRLDAVLAHAQHSMPSAAQQLT